MIIGWMWNGRGRKEIGMIAKILARATRRIGLSPTEVERLREGKAGGLRLLEDKIHTAVFELNTY